MQRCRSRVEVFGVDHFRVSLSLPSLPLSPFFPDALAPSVNPTGREGRREGERERDVYGIRLAVDNVSIKTEPPSMQHKPHYDYCLASD